MRIKYWSCTEFADKIRGTNKPSSETPEGWNVWNKLAKSIHPFRYWLAETALDKIQNILYLPYDSLHSFAYWFNRRFIEQSHVIQTGLKKGEWHETEEKILHGVFNELMEFVEGQKASMSWHPASYGRNKNDHFVPWTEKNSITRNLTNWKSQHYGVQHLIWEIGLVYNEDWGMSKDDPEYGKPTSQAIAALEVLDLYCWWKFIRPNRVDPMEASGYNEYLNSYKISDLLDFDAPVSPDRKEHQSRVHDLCDECEAKYEKEDEENLIRLIKIRRSMWT